MTNLSIIIPTYNERENILALANRIISGLKNVNFELIFVDDASTDGTHLLAEDICHQHCLNFTSVSMKKHIGQHACIRHGITLAHGKYICVMSADLQEPIYLISKMLEKCSAEADLVVAVRDKRQDNIITDIFAKLFNSFLHCFLTTAFPPTGFDFYVFTTTLRYQMDLNIQHFSYPQLDLLKCAQKISYVKYVRSPRIYGKTKWSFFARLMLAVRIIYKYLICKNFYELL